MKINFKRESHVNKWLHIETKFPQVGVRPIFGYLKGAFRINPGSDHCCGLPSMLRRNWRYLGAFDPVYILQIYTQNVSLHQTNCLLFIVGLNLIHWMFVKAYRFCEYFAGDGNLSWCFKQFGFPGLSFDTNYGGRYNDIMEPAGFACLPSFISGIVFENKLPTNNRQYVLATENTTSISIWKLLTTTTVLKNAEVDPKSVCIFRMIEKWLAIFLLFGWKKLTVCLLSNHWLLRNAILGILQLHPMSLVVLAPVCSGFSFMCSSQSRRYWFCPAGDESVSWVKFGNVMSVRVVLLCWLSAALGHIFLVEQPESARFGDMPRWKHFVEQICWVSCLYCKGVAQVSLKWKSSVLWPLDCMALFLHMHKHAGAKKLGLFAGAICSI